MDLAVEVTQAARMDKRRDDDLIDRCLRIYTFGALVFFAIIIGAGSYFGDKISCMHDLSYSSATKYIENDCYLGNTHSFNFSTSMNTKDDTTRKVTFYQWSILILIWQILLLLLPNFIWKATSPSFRKITEIARGHSFVLNQNEQKDLVRRTTLVIRNVISHPNSTKLVSSFIFVKIMTVVIIILELVTCKYVIGGGSLKNVFFSANPYDTDNSRFPLLTRCKAVIYSQSKGGNNEIGAQCIMPNNILLFYFYQFFVYWFSFLLILSVSNLIWWCFSIFSVSERKKYILSRIHNKVSNIDGFVALLGIDGTFMLHMISKNASNFFCSMLTENLYTMYIQSKLNLDIQQ